jgi:hypothetical protein
MLTSLRMLGMNGNRVVTNRSRNILIINLVYIILLCRYYLQINISETNSYMI